MESAICPAGVISEDADFRLIETFAVRPEKGTRQDQETGCGGGIARKDLHLARMAASAVYFEIPFDRQAAEQKLAEIAKLTGGSALRCRMTLSAYGALEVSTSPMPERAESWRFAISDEELRSSDGFLRHKTTRRKLYDRARAELVAGLDEILFLNERGELCEGTITNIMIASGEGDWLTPPLSSGCLPGVFRQSLLNEGRLKEAALTLADLACAQASTHGIVLTNALRGAIKADWSPECRRRAEALQNT